MYGNTVPQTVGQVVPTEMSRTDRDIHEIISLNNEISKVISEMREVLAPVIDKSPVSDEEYINELREGTPLITELQQAHGQIRLALRVVLANILSLKNSIKL